jgi:hypothetical protein
MDETGIAVPAAIERLGGLAALPPSANTRRALSLA